MPKDISLSDYMEQLVKIQANTGSINADQLKELALECGFSEYEWEQLQAEAEINHKNGKGHLEYKNYEEAIRHFDLVLQINPFHSPSLFGMAQAHQGQYQKERNRKSAKLARAYANRLLRVKPGDTQAIQLIKQLNKGQSLGKPRIALAAVGVMLILAIGLAVFFLTGRDQVTIRTETEVIPLTSSPVSDEKYNEVIRLREAVRRQWAQVENVMQRRSDVVTLITPLIRASEHFEEEMIDKVIQAQKALEDEVDPHQSQSLVEFHQKNQELSSQLNLVLETLKDPQLNTVKRYRDFQVQIERSENRISIERKRYNEAVEKYNGLIQQKPYDTFGFETLPYFAQQTQP